MADYMNPIVPSPGNGDYFSQVRQLMALRQMASRNRPSAGDLIEGLDSEARQSGYDRVGALYRGVSADEFFQGNSRFRQMEQALAQSINPGNVCDTFDLLQFAGHYAPTSQVANAFRRNFEIRIAREQSAGEPDGTPRPSPFRATPPEV